MSRTSYLETAAHDYATNHSDRFADIIGEFVPGIEVSPETERECYQIYKEYKEVLCIFTNVLNLGYLFEHDNREYNALSLAIENADTRKFFEDLYEDYLGRIYKRLIGKTHRRLGGIERIDHSNEVIHKLYKCVQNRIVYHMYCVKYTKKYNVKGHEHEILFSIFLLNKILEVQRLMNLFVEKYQGYKSDKKNRLREERRKIREEKKRMDRRDEEIDQELYELVEMDEAELTLTSESLDEPFLLSSRQVMRSKPQK